MQWALQGTYGVKGVTHYLDDFLFIGEEGTQDCGEALQDFKRLADHLGVLIFLGIELDTVVGVSRLPVGKVQALVQDTQASLAKDKATLGSNKSLLGNLNFAGRVIPSGRVFARRLARATAKVRKKHHLVRLSKGVKKDLLMWAEFLANFNGSVIWRAPWAGSPSCACSRIHRAGRASEQSWGASGVRRNGQMPGIRGKSRPM